METFKNFRWIFERSWRVTLASLLPFWLLTMAVSSEGFPKPLLPDWLAWAAFWLSIVTAIVLVWKGWLEVDLVLYSVFPILLMFKFDEISTAYKTPFLLLCGLILTIGMIGAKRSGSVTLRWLFLLVFGIVTWMLASHADNGYWHMVGNMVFGECFPYAQDCLPQAGTEIPWWVLFFKP